MRVEWVTINFSAREVKLLADLIASEIDEMRDSLHETDTWTEEDLQVSEELHNRLTRLVT